MSLPTKSFIQLLREDNVRRAPGDIEKVIAQIDAAIALLKAETSLGSFKALCELSLAAGHLHGIKIGLKVED